MRLRIPWPVPALASGLLLSCAFPPLDMPWLAAAGLVPLLSLLIDTEAPAGAAGFLAGLVFFLICGHPLTSASVWSGWAVADPDQLVGRFGSQWWLLRGLWVLFAVWCAAWWAGWALVTRAGWSRGPWQGLLVSASSWVLLAEWGRSGTT